MPIDRPLSSSTGTTPATRGGGLHGASSGSGGMSRSSGGSASGGGTTLRRPFASSNSLSLNRSEGLDHLPELKNIGMQPQITLWDMQKSESGSSSYSYSNTTDKNTMSKVSRYTTNNIYSGAPEAAPISPPTGKGSVSAFLGGGCSGGNLVASSAFFPSLNTSNNYTNNSTNGPRDHPLRSRRAQGLGIETAISADPTVRALEERLGLLEGLHAKKQSALDRRNEAMIERDRKRHVWYQTEFESAELVEAQRLEQLRAELQRRLDAVCEEEARQRASEEEEEAYEYRNELSMLHLSIYGTTVALVTADSERKQNQLRLQEEEEQRRADTHQKLVAMLEKEAVDAMREVERAETNGRKVLQQQLGTAQEILKTILQSKKKEDDTKVVRELERAHALEEAARAQAVADAEAALEERLRRLDEKCKRVKIKPGL